MSLKEIARLAGTSVSTVSRVLNDPNYHCRRPELYDKIWNLAGELNYLPNPSARSLRLGESASSAPLCADLFLTRFDSMDQDLFFRELYQHIREELLLQNCHMGKLLNAMDIMALCNTQGGVEKVPYRSLGKLQAEKQENPLAFIHRKPHTGLIILGKCPGRLLPILKKRYGYIAGIDRNPTDYEFDEVVCSGTTAAETAMEYLISLGHREIAYVGDCTFESRYIGYYQSLLNHKIPLNYAHVHPTDHTREEGYRTMLQILNQETRPTAIFCANDCTALGVLEALRKHSRRGYLPSVISIDNIREAQKTTPLLTTINIPKKEMAHLAVTLLLDRYHGSHTENVRLELPCRLVIRESCNYI